MERTLYRLSFQGGRWCVTYSGPDATLILQVKYDATESQFKMVAWREGEEAEVLDRSSFFARVAGVMDHEGKDNTEAKDLLNEAGVYLASQWLGWLDQTFVDRQASMMEYWNAVKTLINLEYTL